MEVPRRPLPSPPCAPQRRTCLLHQLLESLQVAQTRLGEHVVPLLSAHPLRQPPAQHASRHALHHQHGTQLLLKVAMHPPNVGQAPTKVAAVHCVKGKEG